MIADLFQESVGRRAARLLSEQQARDVPLKVYLSHHSTDGAQGLWAGFEAARLEVLSRVARGEGCPAVLVFGLHSHAVVREHEVPAGVLSHPAIQYLRISQLEDEAALSEALEAALAGRSAAMPPAFQRGSFEALGKALSGVAHCLHNVAPIVQSWTDAAQQGDMEALPSEIPAFARRDQRETLERLAIFEPLVRELTAGTVSLQPIVDDWHALERAWQELQSAVADTPVDGVPHDLQARLKTVQTTTGQATARIKEAQTRLRQVAGERVR